MKFHVGPYVYTLVVSDGSIHDEEGCELDGLAVESHRLLILSRRLDLDRRVEIAFHEYLHAWGFHVPEPRTEEERVNLATMARGQFERDLDDAGGEDALRKLAPVRIGNIGTPPPKARLLLRETATGPADRMPCPTCDAPVLCGDISHGEPLLHEATRQWRIQRWFRCDVCGTVQVWWEQCTDDGAPLGVFVPVPKPRLLRGREAAQWLADQKQTAAACD